MSDLAPARFAPLRRAGFGDPYLYAVECPSTQELLRDRGLPEGAVAVAEHQTAGRGRQGRSWDDATGQSLLCSVLLRPKRARPEQLSLVTALATAEAIERACECQTLVKWPNDVLVGGGKVAGILLEQTGHRVVAGIGVNVGQTADELPTGARRPAASLRTATGRPPDRGALLALLLELLELRYREWEVEGLEPARSALAGRDALLGLDVRVGELKGVVSGIAAGGGIALRLASGRTAVVESGEVEVSPRVDVGE